MSNDLEFYGSLNLEVPKIPDRSKLYYLQPIAIDTPYIEGLVSYICRLAEAHSVSPRTLIQKEILPSFREIYSVGFKEIYKLKNYENTVLVSSLPKPVNNKNPNEQGLWAWQYIEGLKRLTLKENLEYLTIPRWLDRVLQEKTKVEVARQVRAWCPECFQHWEEAKQPVYEPLLWSLVAVTVCPHHCHPLQYRCPHCQRTQRPLSGTMQVARCSYCFNWLNVRPEQSSEAERSIIAELEWHLWVVERVLEVLAVTSHPPPMETREAITHKIYSSEQPCQVVLTDQLTYFSQLKLLEVFVKWSD